MSLHKKTTLAIAVISAINFSANAQMMCSDVYKSQAETVTNLIADAGKKPNAPRKPRAQVQEELAETKAKEQEAKDKAAVEMVEAKFAEEARGAKAAKPPKDGDFKKAAERMWAGSPREKALHLKQVHNWMYYRFPGREAQIDRIMAAVKVVVLTPQMIKKPISIELFGLAGDGKTAIVTQLSEFLGLGNRATVVKIQDRQLGIDLETYRNLADIPADGKGPSVSFLILDEWQKLAKASTLKEEREIQFNGTFGPEKKIVNEIKERSTWNRLLYDIYGNGSEKAPPSKSLEIFAAEIEATLKNMSTARESSLKSVNSLMEVKKKIEESKEASEKQVLEASLPDLQKAIEREQKKASDLQKLLATTVKKMLRDYADLMGPYLGLKSEEVVNEIMKSQETFVEFLKSTAEDASQYQRTYSYKQMITFKLGNPEQAIKELKDSIRGQNMDADQYHQAVSQITNKQLVDEMFTDIFGDSMAGLRQRINVDQWNIMPALTKEQWKTFVERQIEVTRDEFQDFMAKSEVPNVQMLVHKSVNDFLMNEAVISTEGARVYFERATALTGNFLSDLGTRIIELEPSLAPEQIQWSYEPSTREFVVSAWKGGKQIFDERAPVAKLGADQSTIKLDDYDINRAVLQKAGQIIMGISAYRQLPTSFRFDPEMVDASVNGLWNSPSKARHSTISDFVNLALGSNVTQNLARDGFTALGDPSLKFAHEMVRRMVDDLRKREQEYAFLIERAEDGKKVYLENFPKPTGLSVEVLEAMKEAVDARANEKENDSGAVEQAALGKVLRLMIQDVNLTLQNNSEFLNSLSQLIRYRYKQFQAGQIASPEITVVDLQQLVVANKKYAKRPPITHHPAVMKMAKWLHLPVRALPKSLVITPESIGGAPGQIGVVDPLNFGPKQRIKPWDHIMHFFFGKPYQQRTLNPR